jgi:cysteate synthase
MVEAGEITKDACIMLNITGAGEEAAKSGHEMWHLKPSKVFPLTASIDEVVEYVETLF